MLLASLLSVKADNSEILFSIVPGVVTPGGTNLGIRFEDKYAVYSELVSKSE